MEEYFDAPKMKYAYIVYERLFMSYDKYDYLAWIKCIK